jgi:O-methyltransferase
MLLKIINKTINKIGYEIQPNQKILFDSPLLRELNAEEKEILKYILSENLTMVSLERLFTTITACKHALDHDVQGDFVECGVWRGGNAMAAAEIFKLYKSDKSVWLFDTFKGMTPPTN